MEINASRAGATAAAQRALSGAPAESSKELDQDAFMKLLTTQMQAQDPLNPMDNTQFVAQLSQFASLERLDGMTRGMESMAMSMGANTSAQMVAFVGKRVEVASDALRLSAGRAPSELIAELEAPAEEVTITIKDEDNKVVRTIELGAQQAGELSIEWDGLDDDGGPLPEGEYRASVDAKDEEGAKIASSTWAARRVVGVRFEGGLPQLELEGGARSSLADVRHVGDGPSARAEDTTKQENQMAAPAAKES